MISTKLDAVPASVATPVQLGQYKSGVLHDGYPRVHSEEAA